MLSYAIDYIGDMPFAKDSEAELVRALVDRSGGIFLWTKLTCKSLMRGQRNIETSEEVLHRLNKTPKGLDELYGHLIDRLDPESQETVEAYFQVMSFCRRLSNICTLAGMFDAFSMTLQVFTLTFDEEADQTLSQNPGDEHFLDLESICLRMVARIKARTHGLLEIVTQGPDDQISLRMVTYIHRSLPEYLEEKAIPSLLRKV